MVAKAESWRERQTVSVQTRHGATLCYSTLVAYKTSRSTAVTDDDVSYIVVV